MKNQKNILKMAALVVGFIGLCSFMAVNWKTYSNKYLTMKYPDTYKITDEEVTEDGFDFCCEIKNDDISMVQVSIMKLEDLSTLIASEKDEVMQLVVESMKEEVMNGGLYKNASCSAFTKVKKGKYSGCVFTFNATIMKDNVLGEGFVAFSGDNVLITVSQAESSSYMKTLNQIVEGIVLK